MSDVVVKECDGGVEGRVGVVGVRHGQGRGLVCVGSRVALSRSRSWR